MAQKPVPYLNTVLNTLNEAVFIYDQNMEIQYFNAAAEKITGHASEDVLGKKCTTLFDQSICLNNCALCMSVKQAQHSKVTFNSAFIRKDGVRRIGDFQAGLLHKDGKGNTEVLVSLTDITEVTRLKQELQETNSFRNMVAKSPEMKEVFGTIQNVAYYDSTVFIEGESGTGKELVASAIHYESPRAGKNLIKVNCSAFSDSLLESELFGHVKGAFTGALQDRIGRFEEASGGTIFLDEVGDMSPGIQVKLLRVLQEKEIERVGENRTRKVDIRIIAATNKNLKREVDEGRFREDLYYRLNVFPVHMPPLRQRKEDIPLLAERFIDRWKSKHRKRINSLSGETLGQLMDHSWPGNVRELGNAIEHACIKALGPTIELRDLPAYLLTGENNDKVKRKRKWLTQKIVKEALEACDHNQTRAAEHLKVHRITLWRKLKEFNL
ncbi:MAG: sigma 54-interacting transcriptional regulator [Nitrospinota bacterium]|nr:sigma 54-interacting transcriptional regulator [Nitrospinota bacterium]